MFRHFIAGLLLAASAAGARAQSNYVTPHPILFVTVFPIRADFATIGSVFANHLPDPDDTGRGGDLWIRYPNGQLRNITREEGFGVAGIDQSGADAIAVRDVSVHWNATRAVFSLVRGEPAYWQMYEVVGPGLLSPQGELQVVKVPNQPVDFNNIDATYASDGTLIFTSDRPRSGERHLYPQLDEYESTPTVTGLWRLNPATGELFLMNHLPSGAFGPFVDSFGRVVFTRWDHLERDQQEGPDTFNWLDESDNAFTFPSTGTDVFPEHKSQPLPGHNEHFFNFFLPWQINQDGTGEEVLNHLGRHELAAYFTGRLTNDPRVVEFVRLDRPTETAVDEDGGVLHIAENPRAAGCFVATEADEFGRHASGRLLRWCAPPETEPSDVVVDIVNADGSGSYRDPMFLDDAAQTIIAAHTATEEFITSGGAIADPDYRFRLKVLAAAGNGRFAATGAALTDNATMTRQVSFGTYNYNEPMWEFSPAEVRVRPAPAPTGFGMAAPELSAFQQAGVDVQDFRDFLETNNLGVIVVRDATSRDRADKQQPFNLRVPGGRETLERDEEGDVVPGTVYEIAFMQMLQADQIRGWLNPARGRRVIAQFLHDANTMTHNTHATANLPGGFPIHADGSVAMYVPTRRALSWQTVGPAPQYVPTVLERYWITLQPGEIRTCDGCHGVNTTNQANQPASTQTADAFVDLLTRWKQENPSDRVFRHGFEGS
jgi:hypothetical protein